MFGWVALVIFLCSVSTTECTTTDPPGQWRVIKGMDNMFDLKPCCTYGLNITTLQQMCLAQKWCAGFSSFFGSLKYSVEGLGPQAQTDMWVRIPPPPALPPPTPAYLWPRPSSYTTGTSLLAINATGAFSFNATGKVFPMLMSTLERYTKMLQGEAIPPPAGTTLLRSCIIDVQSTDTTLFQGVDEGYTLTVSSDGTAALTAATVFGAMRGLETFVGLWDTPDRTFRGAPLVVSDGPRYLHRGLMIDTARHFLPVQVLLDHLEALSAAKMNVLHWHLIDQQSWPLNLSSLPLAARDGSYNAALATYSPSDVRTVVEAAYARGIRVIPELDMPAGHFSSILLGYPSFGAGPTLSGTLSANLDPTKEDLWIALDGLFKELSDLFIDECIHVGFDEVNLNDWNTTAITDWRSQNNMTSLTDVESYFLSRIRSIAASYNRRLIIWNDPIGEGVNVPVDAALQVWNSGLPLVQSLLHRGYNVTYSSPFYLDHLENTWDVIFAQTDLDTATNNGTGTLLGAEACMWGEQVDITNAESRVWPRAAALAEILWSPGYDTYPRIASLNIERMEMWRCRARGRGVSAEPIQPGWCPRAPH